MKVCFVSLLPLRRFCRGVGVISLLLLAGGYDAAAQSAPGSDELPNAAPKVFKRIQDSLRKYEQVGEQIGKKAGQFIEQNGEADEHKIGPYTYKGPKKHPFIENDGHDSDDKAAEEYVADSKAALNQQTFPGCFEERKVNDPVYTGMCIEDAQHPAANCPENIDLGVLMATGQCVKCIPGLNPLCIPQDRYVSEFYFPIYQVRVFPGRAMGSFSVEGKYLSGSDKRPELGLKQTKQRVDQEAKSLVQEVMQQLGLPQPQGEDFGPEEYNPSVDWYGTDGEAYNFHSLTYQTNVHRVATRSRQPEAIKRWGYDLVTHCFWQTLDNPAKEVISNASYGPKEYMLAAMWAKATEDIKPDGMEAAKQTIISPGTKNMFSIIEGVQPAGEKLPQQLQGLRPSLRSDEWSEWMQDLKKVGVEPKKLSPRDYVFYGLSLAPFNSFKYNSFHDPLYAGIGHGITHYYLTGLPQSDFSPNLELRRALWLTRYKAREGKGRQGYSGEDPFLRDPIVFTDKFNMVFPPLEDGDPRKPTHCIRPENVARVEPPQKEGSAVARSLEGGWFNIPITLRARFPQYGIQKINDAQEVRLVFWKKRVACFCQLCGVVKGCLNLNDGDVKEDNFYGQEPFSGGASARLRNLLGTAAGYSGAEPKSSKVTAGQAGAVSSPIADFLQRTTTEANKKEGEQAAPPEITPPTIPSAADLQSAAGGANVDRPSSSAARGSGARAALAEPAGIDAAVPPVRKRPSFFKPRKAHTASVSNPGF